jgi:hypothetical protein
MPITSFLNGSSHSFDSETRRAMGVAYEMVRAALHYGDTDTIADKAIANKIIELAIAGEKNPDLALRRNIELFSATLIAAGRRQQNGGPVRNVVDRKAARRLKTSSGQGGHML